MHSSNIGKKLKELRMQKKWNQQHVAKKMNVTRGTVSNWEIGRRIPDVKTLEQLSLIHNVSIDFFIPNTDKNEIEDLLARASELFKNAYIDDKDKIELHNKLVKIYLISQEKL